MVEMAVGCQVRDVMAWMEESFPAEAAEPWDLVGLQVGDPEALVKGILVALDPTREALDEARGMGASLLVTHHPVWLGPLKAIRADQWAGSIVLEALRTGIHILCAHTNLDRAQGGPNDLMAGLLGLERTEPFASGLGRVGDLPREMDVAELCQVLAALHPRLRAVGPRALRVRRVAVSCGSGASLLEQARESGAQLFVTGDVKYHDGRLAEFIGVAVVDAGHFGTERALVPWLAERLREASAAKGWGVPVWSFEGQQDPFWEPAPREHG